MDERNNAIGLSIGRDARTYEEVVARARAAIEAGIGQGGSGRDGTPSWRAAETWGEHRERSVAERSLPVTWPDGIPSAAGYRFGGTEFGAKRVTDARTPRQREAALLERLQGTPTEEWSEADVRAAINARPYGNPAEPGHAELRAKVRQYFRQRMEAEGDGGQATGSSVNSDDCGGVAPVRAYTLTGPSGPVQVGAHSRTVPCD